MAEQTEILKALAAAGDAGLPLDSIVAATGLTGSSVKARRHRKAVLECLGRLKQRKLAERTNPGKADGMDRTEVAGYRATRAGMKLIADGKRVTSGPVGNLNGPRDPLAGSLRDRLWKAFRLMKRGSIPEMLELIRTAEDGDDVSRNAQTFFKRLVMAGIAVELKARAQGDAPSSPGFKRFSLIKDVGPLSPVTGGKDVFDPNTHKRIAYRTENAA